MEKIGAFLDYLAPRFTKDTDLFQRYCALTNSVNNPEEYPLAEEDIAFFIESRGKLRNLMVELSIFTQKFCNLGDRITSFIYGQINAGV